MRKIFNVLLSLIVVLGTILPFVGFSDNAQANSGREWKDAAKDVPTNKIWTIKLNQALDVRANIEEFVYVIDEQNNKVDTDIAYSKDQKELYVQPPVEGYKTNTNYILVIDESLKSTKGKKIKGNIYQKFTTSDKQVGLEDFTARSDSKNEVILKDEVNTVNKQDVKLINENTLELTGDYKVGDILALPANEVYPFGYFKKITSIKSNGEKITAKVIDPNIEEVVDKMDISTAEGAKAKNIVLSKQLTENEPSEKFVKALGEVHPSAFVEQDGDKTIINLLDIAIEKELDDEYESEFITSTLEGEGGIKISGTYTFDKLNVIFDNNFFIVNAAGLEMNSQMNFSAEAYGNLKGEAEIHLGEIPVPYASVKFTDDIKIGSFIDIYLVIDASVEGEVKTSIDQRYSAGAGLKREKNEGLKRYKYLNKEDADVLPPTGSFALGLGVGPKVTNGPKIGNLSMGEMGMAIPVKFEVSGSEIFTSNACFDYNFGLGAEFNLKILFTDEYTQEWGIPLGSGSTCEVKDIQFKNKSEDILIGEKKKLDLYLNPKNAKQKFNLPNSKVDFKTDTPSIVEVLNDGTVKVKKNAKHGDVAKVTATYSNGKKETRKTDTVEIHVVSEDLEEEEETPEEPIEEVPEGNKNPVINDGAAENTTFYKKNYEVSNSGNSAAYIKVEGPAHYVTYDKKGAEDTKYTGDSENYSIYLQPGSKAVISYLNKLASPPTTSSSNVNIVSTTTPAFKVYDVSPQASIRLETSNSTNVFVKNGTLPVSYDVAVYRPNETVDSYSNIVNNNVQAKVLAGGQSIITNDSDKVLQVFGVYPYISCEISEDPALVYKQVESGESITITTTEPISSSSTVKVANDSKYIKFSEASYKADKAVSTIRELEKTYAENYEPEAEVIRKGETVIENTGKKAMFVYGPQKYINYAENAEGALNALDLASGESVTVASNEPSINASYVKVINDEQRVNYNYAVYDENNVAVSFDRENTTYFLFDPTVGIKKNGTTVIENTGENTIRILGAKKYVTYEKNKERALMYETLEPNESVTVTTTQPTNQVSKFAMVNDGRYVKYNYATYNSNKSSSSFGQKETTYNASIPILSVLKDGRTVVENTGVQNTTLFGPARHIQYEKNKERPLKYIIINPGESKIITSTEPYVDKSTFYAINDDKYVKFDEQAYYEDGKEYFSHMIEKEGKGSVFVMKNGKTIITNKGEKPLRIYGPFDFIQ